MCLPSEQPSALLVSFRCLFYFSRIFGLIPHSFTEYFNRKKLRPSQAAIIWILICLTTVCGLYHYLMLITSFPEAANSSGKALTNIIAMVLNYMGPTMMAIDMLSSIRNRQKVIDLFEEFRVLDSNLAKQNIIIDNSRNAIRINILIISILILEFSIAIYTSNLIKELNYAWMIASIPSVLSAMDKVWFGGFLFSLKQRFNALNLYMDQTVIDFAKLKKLKANRNSISGGAEETITDSEHRMVGYLHKEIAIRNISQNIIEASERMNSKILTVLPWNELAAPPTTTATKPSNNSKIRKAGKLTILQSKMNILTDMQNVEDKLNNLCRLHDEMCEIGKTLNNMWNIQMLLLMAYGFLSITAQFYFLYCSLWEQPVPTLFKSSGSLYLSLVFVGYVAAKCVYLIYQSWLTKIESRRTGVCLHKCALVVDENNFYEIVNHISLKLMNHSVDFSACGFFNLDMTTVYGVTGAITSYLIILIQFNLAEYNHNAANKTVTTDTSAITEPTN